MCCEQQDLHQRGRDWKLVRKGKSHNKFIGWIVSNIDRDPIYDS